VRRALVLVAVLGATAVGAALAYKAAARDSEYRALLARGDAALRAEQTYGALEAYSGAIALRPDSMLAHLRRGETYERRGDLNRAAIDFRTAAGIDPSATRALDELGDVFYERQRFRNAADTYADCLRVDDRSATVTYKLALARYRDGDLDAALATVRQAVRLNDRSPDAQYLLGLCLREQGQVTAAQKALEKAVALSPGLIPAREELADLYGSVGRRAEELEQLQVLAALDRDHVQRQAAVGLAHARAGHDDLAVLTLGSALERTPDQPLIYGALGEVWLDIARRDPRRPDALSKALDALERAASAPGATSDVLTLYGRALLQAGQSEAAERALRQAIERFPIEPTALVFFATAAERQNHLERARQALIAYNALVSDDPAFVPHASRIATLSLRLNDVATAIDWLQKTAAASPNDARLLAELADAQLRYGDYAAAKVTVAKGLDKDPKNAALLTLARRLR
jgi:tetratricopeptide (TPR) repeat protein